MCYLKVARALVLLYSARTPLSVFRADFTLLWAPLGAKCISNVLTKVPGSVTESRACDYFLGHRPLICHWELHMRREEQHS